MLLNRDGYGPDGRRRYFFDLGNDTQAAADTAPLAAASNHAADVALELGTKAQAQQQQFYDDTMKVVKPVVDADLKIKDQALNQGADYYDYMKANARPVETALKDRAMTDTTAADAAARGGVTTAQTNAADQLKTGGDTMYQAGMVGANKMLDSSNTLAGNLTSGTKGITNDLNSTVAPILTNMVDKTQGATTQMYNAGAGVLNQLVDRTGNISSGLTSDMRGVGSNLTSGVNGISSDMTGKVGDVAGNMEAGIQRIGSNLTSGAGTIAGVLTAGTAGVAQNLTNKADTVAGNINNRIAGYEDKIGGKIDTITGGNQAIYGKYGADIEGDVGRAVADARAGQTEAAGRAARTALRYGTSIPAASSATEIANAEGLAAAANNARTAGIDKARGNLVTGAGLESNLMQTAGNQAIASGGLETDAGKAVLGANANALDTGAKLQTGALTDASQMDANALGSGAAMRSGVIQNAAGMNADALGKSTALTADALKTGAAMNVDANKTGTALATDVLKTGTGMNVDALKSGTALATDTLNRGADLNAKALTGGVALQDAGTRSAIDLAKGGVQDQINLTQAGLQGDVKAADTGRSLAIADDARSFGKLASVDELYKGLPGASTGAYTVATNAGNSAVANTMAPSQTFTQGTNAANSTIMQGQGLNVQGQTAILGSGTSYANALNSQPSSLGGLGSVLGGAAALYTASSKKLKTNKEPVSDEAALAGIMRIPVDKEPLSEEGAIVGLQRIPVEKWDYKDGEGDGGTHVGPYAEDVQREFGDAAAPGGKAIDLVSMNGITIAALKGLEKKVAGLERIVRKSGNVVGGDAVAVNDSSGPAVLPHVGLVRMEA